MTTPEPRGSNWRVLKLREAIKQLLFTMDRLKEQIDVLQSGIYFELFVDGAWTNPIFPDNTVGFETLAIETLLFGNGRIRVFKGQGQDFTEINFQFIEQCVAHFDEHTLEQRKKRHWGLIIKTRNRKPTHRGPKSDLVYIRIPHK